MGDYVIIKDATGKRVGKRKASVTAPLPPGLTAEPETTEAETTPLVGPDPSERRKHSVDEPREMSASEHLKATKPPEKDPAQAEQESVNDYLRNVRSKLPRWHVPGEPPRSADTEGSEWTWDGIKKKIPAALRQASLIGNVWAEPTDEEAAAAGAKTPLEVLKYKDAKWQEAGNAAYNSGKPIYRDSEIRVTDPSFIRVSQALTAVRNKGEAFVRGIDKSYLMGAGSAVVDTEYDWSKPPGEFIDKEATKRNIERGDRIMSGKREEVVPWSAEPRKLGNENFVAAGQLAGTFSPMGASGAIAGTADKLLKAGAHMGTSGAVQGIVRGAASAAAGTFAADLGAGEVDAAKRDLAGMEHASQGELVGNALTSAAYAAPLGGALAAAGAVSKSIRGGEVNDRHAAALGMHDEYGGKTHWLEGERPPPGSADLALEAKKSARTRTDVGRDRAVDAIFPELADTQASATGRLESAANDLEGQFHADLTDADRAVRSVADDAIVRGKAVDTSARANARVVSDKIFKRINEIIPEQAAEGQFSKEAAIRAEEADAVSGLSMRPVVDKYKSIVKSMSWADDTAMPNTTVKKFKEAIDSITTKKIVSADDLPLYEAAAVSVKPIKAGGTKTGSLDDVYGDSSGMASAYEVTLPRKVRPRELTDFISRMDEMANYEGGAGGVDSGRFKQIAASAREVANDLRTLSASQTRAHEEMLMTERMLESTGLKRTYGATKGEQTLTAQGTVLDNVAASDGPFDSSQMLKREEFDQWLSAKDPELFDEYVGMRKLQRQREGVNAFGISQGRDVRGAAMDDLVKLIKGEPDKFARVADELGMGVEAKAARQKYQQAAGVMEAIGMKIPDEMSAADRLGNRETLLKTLATGEGPGVEKLKAAAKPEQRPLIESAARASREAEASMSKLGISFKPGVWKEAEEATVKGAVANTLNAYRTHGSGAAFNNRVYEMMVKHPEFAEAVAKFRGEKNFSELRRSTKEGAIPTLYNRVSWDFINHRLDALMGEGQRGVLSDPAVGGKRGKLQALAGEFRSPFGAPTEYAMGLASDTPGEGSVPVIALAGRQGLDFLMALSDAATKALTRKEKQP